MNNNEEVIIKMIGSLTLEFNFNWDDQRKARDVLETALYGYTVTTTETSLVKGNIDENIFMFYKVKELQGYSKETLKNYMYVLKNFSLWLNKPVASVTKNDIRMYLMTITSNKKPSTMNTITYIIKGFFTWLEEEDIIPKSPAKKLETTKLPKRLRKSLTIEELEKLRIACKDDRERCLVEFLFATGCRVSEVVTINTENLNMNDNTITVIGKGNVERVVCFSNKTKVYIQNYLNSKLGDDPALFTSIRKPYKRIHKRGIEIIITKIASRCNFDKSVFPHLLRHTFATLSYQSGADLTTIQHLLGHTTPATTQIYSEQDMDNIKHEYKQHFIQ
ncbi:MAG: site-specific tyrosine recombinase/integron integrase [Cetobacterium sp.]